MTIEVTLPDGSIAEFPDGTAPNVMESALQKHVTATSKAAQFGKVKQDIRESTAKGGDPWYRAIPDLAGDPFGVMDEIVGGAAAAEEYAKAPFQKGFWSGESSGLNEKAGEAYTAGAERTRALREVRRERFGILPEIAGGMGSVGRGIVSAPNWLARARQSAIIGGGFGAATGFTQSEGGVEERLGGALKGGVTGAIVGPALTEVALPAAIGVGRGIAAGSRYGRQALASVRNPEQTAIENVADRLVTAGIDPAQLRTGLTSTFSHALQARGFTDEHLADIISRQAGGETATAVARDYAHLVNRRGQAVTPATVRGYFTEYQRNNPTPLNIGDLAQEIAGPGGSKPIMRLGRAANSLAGDELAGPAAEALMGRQATQAGRVTNIVEQRVGGGNFEARQQAAQTAFREESARNYAPFYAEPDLAVDQLGDLMADSLFRRASLQAQRQARVEVMRGNVDARRAGRALEPVPDVDPENQVFSPQMLDYIQRQLRITSEGFVNNPTAAQHARNLREVFLDRIEDHYPTFRNIRRTYAEGRMEQDAMTAGEALTMRLGAPSREALQAYERMSPAQQELFRLGFGRKLQDMAATPREGAAIANQFQTGSVQQIIERIFRSADPATNRTLQTEGTRLLRDLRREALTTNTKNEFLAGSRTAELGNDMERAMQIPKAAADLATGRFGKILENLSTRLATQLGSEGAGQVLRILTETDPARLLPIMNRLSRAAQTTQQRQAYVSAIRQLRSAGVARLSAPIGISLGRMQAVSDQQPVAARP